MLYGETVLYWEDSATLGRQKRSENTRWFVEILSGKTTSYKEVESQEMRSNRKKMRQGMKYISDQRDFG